MNYKVIHILTNDKKEHVYVPKYIKLEDVESVQPYIGDNGRMFKNISYIETYNNKSFVIVGNYEYHVKQQNNRNGIGYKNKRY